MVFNNGKRVYVIIDGQEYRGTVSERLEDGRYIVKLSDGSKVIVDSDSLKSGL